MVPPALQRKAAEWYHEILMHPGETRMELTMAQHYCWKGMRSTIQQVCKRCNICKRCKARTSKKGLIPAKKAEAIPWHTLCIDLIGPYEFGDKKKKNCVPLHCLTMIDPATGWFDLELIPSRKADDVINILEFTWLTQYPWPTEVVMDRGKEFQAEVQTALKNEYGLTRNFITTRNPQANAIVETVHKSLHNLICATDVNNKDDLSIEFGGEEFSAQCDAQSMLPPTPHTRQLPRSLSSAEMLC